VRALVTGAAGFIGAQVVRQLIHDGWDVVALVRPRTRMDRLAEVGSSFQRVECDLADTAKLTAELRAAPPELCLHLAWYVAPDVHEAAANFDCVTHGTSLLRMLDAIGCPRSVFVGTYLEYDLALGDLTEETPLRPQNLYAACKHALHTMAESYCRMRGRSFVWARLFNNYGPGEYDGPLVSHIIRRLLDGEPCALTSGEHHRDYLHVEDTARALCALARSSFEGAVNVSSGEEVSIATIARTIGELTGRSDLLRFGAYPAAAHHAARIRGDVTRLRQAVGFQPRYSLRDGLAQTVAWYQASRPSAATP
jgi:nucleoside-diphosphate-sugar epimerase